MHLRYTIRLGGLVLAASASAVMAGPTTFLYDQPTFDRWNYEFNTTPGVRTTASVFGATGEILFDDRDGQFVVGFDTSADVPPGQGPAAYQILRVALILEVANDGIFIYDDTVDPFGVFLDPADPSYVEDDDPGQPIELFGTGFRNGFDAASWGETGPFGPSGAGHRNAFPFVYDSDLEADVSNSVEEGWTPTPWAVGRIDGLAPGTPVPAGSDIVLDVELNDPQILAYLRDGLDSGLVSFNVTSLTLVFEGGGPFPTFFTKEHPLVLDGFASATRLELEVEVGTAMCDEDIDGSGAVDFADLVQLLSNWGVCEASCPQDIDDSGAVDFGDLIRLLSAWGDCP